MIFSELPIIGAWLIKPTLYEDDRGMKTNRLICLKYLSGEGKIDSDLRFV